MTDERVISALLLDSSKKNIKRVSVLAASIDSHSVDLYDDELHDLLEIPRELEIIGDTRKITVGGPIYQLAILHSEHSDQDVDATKFLDIIMTGNILIMIKADDGLRDIPEEVEAAIRQNVK
jgi:hypothetical protein